MQVDIPVPEAIAARQADYLAQAADADRKAIQSRDEMARKAWSHIAEGYRDLAANLAPKPKT